MSKSASSLRLRYLLCGFRRVFLSAHGTFLSFIFLLSEAAPRQISAPCRRVLEAAFAPSTAPPPSSRFGGAAVPCTFPAEGGEDAEHISGKSLIELKYFPFFPPLNLLSALVTLTTCEECDPLRVKSMFRMC